MGELRAPGSFWLDAPLHSPGSLRKSDRPQECSHGSRGGTAARPRGHPSSGRERDSARSANAGTAALRNLASFSYQLLFLLSQLPLQV